MYCTNAFQGNIITGITANISVLVEDTPNYNPRRWRCVRRELNIYKIHKVRDNQDCFDSIYNA